MISMEQAVIQTLDLTKKYGSAIGVSGVDLMVRPGEIFGFLGPNGAGKTTTIRLLMGLIAPTGGRIFLFGQDSRIHRREALKQMGYLPGEVALYKDLTGTAYLKNILALRTEAGGGFDEGRLKNLKDRFRIDFSRRIKTYSKGMKQIVALIQAFMHGPKLVVMDEPTAGLDPIMQEALYELLLEEKARGCTIFFSSHVLGEVERVCDRVGIIKAGRLIREEDLRQRRSLMGKKITMDLGRDALPLLDLLRPLSGVTDLGLVAPNRVQLFYHGEIKDFLARAARYDVQDLTCQPPALEDLFYSLYRE